MKTTRIVAVICLSTLAAAGQKLTLDEAVQSALRNNPRIAADALNALMAAETKTMVRSAYFPTAVANATAGGALNESRLAAGAINNPIIFNRLAVGGSVTQMITDFGRTAKLVEGADFRIKAQEQGANATRAQIVLAVHRAFFGGLRARNVLRVASRTVDARKLALDQISELAKNNLKSTLDVSFANVNLSEARLTMAAAANDYQAALADLFAVMGERGVRKVELADAGDAGAAMPGIDEAIVEALRSRPEIALMRYERDAAARVAEAERKLTLPTVVAFGNGGSAPVHDDRLKNRFLAGAVNMSFPVFNGHQFQARRREADLRVQAIEQRVRDLETVVARDVTVAVLNMTNARERMGLTAELVKQAALSEELAQERYSLGLSSIVELSQAQLNKTAAEMRDTAARYEYLSQKASVEFQTGRLR